jgi:hypothetical protein
MKDQRKEKYIYYYPVLLIILAILVNGCVLLPECPSNNLDLCYEERAVSPGETYNIVIPPDKISSLQVNIQLKDNIHPDVAGEDNPDVWQPHKFSLIDYKLALIQALIDANYNGNAVRSKYVLHANVLEIDQPSHGFRLTTTTKVEYTLKERISGKEILRNCKIIHQHTSN